MAKAQSASASMLRHVQSELAKMTENFARVINQNNHNIKLLQTQNLNPMNELLDNCVKKAEQQVTQEVVHRNSPKNIYDSIVVSMIEQERNPVKLKEIEAVVKSIHQNKFAALDASIKHLLDKHSRSWTELNTLEQNKIVLYSIQAYGTGILQQMKDNCLQIEHIDTSQQSKECNTYIWPSDCTKLIVHWTNCNIYSTNITSQKTELFKWYEKNSAAILWDIKLGSQNNWSTLTYRQKNTLIKDTCSEWKEKWIKKTTKFTKIDELDKLDELDKSANPNLDNKQTSTTFVHKDANQQCVRTQQCHDLNNIRQTERMSKELKYLNSINSNKKRKLHEDKFESLKKSKDN